MDVVRALLQQAREKKRTKETRPAREQHTSLLGGGRPRCHRQGGDVEAKAYVSAHHLGFERPMLAAEIGERAFEAKLGVRSRRRDLIEQVEELANRNLLQHPQIDRP